MLTLEQFNKLPHGEVFRVVVMKSNAATMERDEEGNLIPIETMFVCKKGTTDDWAIYYKPLGVVEHLSPIANITNHIKDYEQGTNYRK